LGSSILLAVLSVAAQTEQLRVRLDLIRRRAMRDAQWAGSRLENPLPRYPISALNAPAPFMLNPQYPGNYLRRAHFAQNELQHLAASWFGG